MAAWRRRILLLGWLVAGAVIVGRAALIQVVQVDLWRQAAIGQHRTSETVPAPRGSILDRDGVPLVVSRESYRVSVAPLELENPQEVQALLQEALGISASSAARAVDPSDVWRPIPGNYETSVHGLLSSVPGIHLERQIQRVYPHGELARAVLGSVIDGSGRGGIEQAYDELLRGEPGRNVIARGGFGPIPGKVVEARPPVPGGEVRTTLRLSLQEIAFEALTDAVESTGAEGGDLVISDPETGEILAMVSVADGRSDALSSITTSYEPGSTLKPFTVATLLSQGAASLDDSVDTDGGRWWVGGHYLNDIGNHGVITLADALRVSSNIGVAKTARALTHEQQFEGLRDFGFGAPTGLPLPGEIGGTLRRPELWSGRSSASLAVGYEIAVTPVQMAMAYGALANGGELMEPRLIRETRFSSGRLAERPEPRKVRRVVSRRITAAIREVLVDVVEGGTGTAARLASFEVAGKSGTSRLYVAGEGYAEGRFFASFVGFFPADDPQLVIFVKLNGTEEYGGTAAGPVTRATMEAVLAARQTSMDRRSLLEVARANELPLPHAPASGFQFASLGPDAARIPRGQTAELAPSRRAATDLVPVPDLLGLPSRVAVRRLHALGFRVEWEGTGPVQGTAPPAGARLVAGDTIRVRSGSWSP